MFGTIVEKELKQILLSPKFTATFTVCSLLLLLSVLIGIQEYRTSVSRFETVAQLNEQQMREQSSWMGLSTAAQRAPDPMQIFVAGVTNDVGRFSAISAREPAALAHSAYADDPIFALFRSMDLAFIVQVVLSLFAILFSYDAINGEREQGTLQLTFANPVPRVRFILAKLMGSWLGLVVPLSLPVALALLLIPLFGIPFDGAHWMRLALVLGMSLLLFTFFHLLGILMSALTRRSSISFLACLAVWILVVLIIPRAGVMAAGGLMPVPSTAEVEGTRDAFARTCWQQHMTGMTERWKQREAEMAGMSKEARAAYRDEHLGRWMQEDDAARKETERQIDDFAVRTNEEMRNRQAAQERLAFTLARLSPAAAYQMAVMELAMTDVGIKARTEKAMQDYRTAFKQFVEVRQQQSGNTGGIRITFDSEKGFQFSTPRERGTLDVSDMPRFTPPRETLASVVPALALNAAVLAGCALVALAGAFVAFLRTDLR